MRRYYDILLDFAIDTVSDTFEMYFAIDWKFTEMLDFMCDKYDIDKNSIIEIRHTYVKRYKVCKDAKTVNLPFAIVPQVKRYDLFRCIHW